MLSAWLNTTIRVQRRAANSSRNTLNEPDYGGETGYPTIYPSVDVRIEFWDETIQFTDTGERVVPSHLDMYVEPDFIIIPQDRITIIASDATPLIGQLYLAGAVYPENNSVGNVHHYIVELMVH